MKTKILIIILSLLAAGCSTLMPVKRVLEMPVGHYEYTAWDQDGNTIATGMIDIYTLVEDTTIGSWEIVTLYPIDRTGPQNGRGTVSGSIIDKGKVRFNLNPHSIENNVFLDGAYMEGVIQGKWGWFLQQGRRAAGTFSMKLKK
jgi:hypothetical protein